MCRFVKENTVLLAEITEEAKELESTRITKERFDIVYEI